MARTAQPPFLFPSVFLSSSIRRRAAAAATDGGRGRKGKERTLNPKEKFPTLQFCAERRRGKEGVSVNFGRKKSDCVHTTSVSPQNKKVIARFEFKN